MSRCKYCEQNNVITEGEWRQTQYGNRLFVNNEQHKCPYYKKAAPTQQWKETSGTYVPQGYVQAPQQIPTPQPPAPEPLAIQQIQTTLDAVLAKLSLLQKDYEKMNERIDFLYRIERANQEGETM